MQPAVIEYPLKLGPGTPRPEMQPAHVYNRTRVLLCRVLFLHVQVIGSTTT